ncbi:hypothetical protein QBC36DRAFT_227644 [Triangularia setosa]|uniref:Mid2 domain-containing protein n=1 Tax=Triangularia setosa TaxID=2587417 RepID=A0AAN6WG46_9PEZI|nr:hypothetical protein QBC36DRAFT_227644 [Podospora setosa]
MMKRHILYSILSILCCIDWSTAINKCYYPGGGEALDDVPCDPDAEVSVCCGRSTSGGGCLSNKLCMGTDGRMSRGSCTDNTWMSPECPNFCTVLRQGIVVTPCLNGNDSSTTHCCFMDRNCCSDKSALFEAPPAQPATTATWNARSVRYVTVQLQPSTSSSSTKTSTSKILTSSFTSTSAANTVAPTESTTTTTPPESAQPTSSPSGDQQFQPQQQSSEALPPATAAGVAIGAVVGAVLIAAVIYLLWRLNKSQKILEQAVARNEEPTSGNLLQCSHPYGLEPPRSPFYHSSQHSYTAETAFVNELPSDRSVGELCAGSLPGSYPSGRAQS